MAASLFAPFRSNGWRRELLVFSGLVLLVLILRLPSLNLPFDNDSAAIAYHARLMLQGEPLYSTHHTGHHLPGPYALFAGAFALFGDRPAAVKGLLILWTIVTVYLLYRLGTLVANRRVGLLAGILAAIFSSYLALSGQYSRIEAFVLLPQTAAIFTTLALSRRQSASWKFVLTGLLLAACFLFKANYLFAPGLVSGLVLLADWWPGRRRAAAGRQLVARGLAVLAGFLLPVVLVTLYYQLSGLGAEFLAVFTNGFNYVAIEGVRLASPVALVIYPLYRLIITNALAAGLGLAALALVAVRTMRRLRHRKRPEDIFFIAVWFLAGFVEVGSSRLLLYYYYLIFVPALAILIAWFIDQVAAQLPRPGLRRAAYVLAIGLILLFSGGQQARYQVEYGRYLAGRQTYAQFLMAGLPENIGVQNRTLSTLADYLARETSPDQTLYYWSNNVALYFQSGRRSAARIIWPLYANTRPYPGEQIFTADTFIVDQEGVVPLGYADHPDWLWIGLEENYTLETVIDGQHIYRHK